MGSDFTQAERDELIALKAEKHKWQSDQGRLAKEQKMRVAAEEETASLRGRVADLEAKASTSDGQQHAPVPDDLKTVLGDGPSGALGNVLQNVRRQATEDAVRLMENRLATANVAANYRVQMSDWETRTGATGFLRRISEGGDLVDSWAAFKDSHPSAAYAERYRDPSAMGEFLDLFAKSKGIEFVATPTPVSGGGRLPLGVAQNANPYTDDDYASDLESLNKARMDKILTPSAYEKERAFIDKCREAGTIVAKD